MSTPMWSKHDGARRSTAKTHRGRRVVCSTLQHLWPIGKRVVWWQVYDGRMNTRARPALVTGYRGTRVVVAPVDDLKQHVVTTEHLEVWDLDQHDAWPA